MATDQPPGSGEYSLPPDLPKSELEDRLAGGFERLDRKADEAPTLKIPVSDVLDALEEADATSRDK